jgi:hypothetical protein
MVREGKKRIRREEGLLTFFPSRIFRIPSIHRGCFLLTSFTTEVGRLPHKSITTTLVTSHTLGSLKSEKWKNEKRGEGENKRVGEKLKLKLKMKIKMKKW